MRCFADFGRVRFDLLDFDECLERRQIRSGVRLNFMNARVDQIFDEARFLLSEDRTMLTLALLDSLEGEQVDEAEVERAWIAEARRRSDGLRDGSIKAVPWAEAKARLSALHL